MKPKRATQVKKNVGLCPSIFCREICSEESSSVECSSCKGWINWRCVPMTYDLLKEWGEGDLPFTCKMCAFDNGAYSASKALERYVCLLYNTRVMRSFKSFRLKSPVVDLTFVFADDNHDDDSASATAAVACVGNDDEDDDTAAVADISDNGTVDYDEDEADDYDDDAVDKDGHFVSTEPDILLGGKPLPLGRFLETEKVIEILQRTSVNDTLSEVPRGKKDDVYFVVQNENNKDKRAQGKISQLWDDRGAWECNSTSRSYFLQENEKLRSVTYRQTKYCIQVIKTKQKLCQGTTESSTTS
ncbi:hypothetical protein PoB_003192900 [Plakobranchus ocellatus]|uniref:Zinc finger PHD-type domain-containing protein n=1 Tax=Plakobranchus ocellatus TaxID=259542 RepID=A0AAV4AG78_9GAST|nr:hypothetical protein PoB_003192900 [Plakobranchus ocellatus]